MNGKSPPSTLGKTGKKLWKDLLEGWDIQREQFVLLQALCESQDRISELTEMLKREGLVVEDRFGQKRPHPATLILKGENGSFARLFKLLALESPSGFEQGPGRPAGFTPELK